MRQSQPFVSASDGTTAAVRARRIRAEVKRDLEFSPESLRAAIAAASVDDLRGQAIARMPVRELLAAMPGVGDVRARNMMQAVGIQPDRRLRGLGRNQTDRLAELIAERQARRQARRG